MEKNRIDIHINGKNYVLAGYETEEHLYKVGKMVDRLVNDISSKFPTMSTTDVGILVALNIADELVGLKDRDLIREDPVAQAVGAPAPSKADSRESLLPKLPQLAR